MSGWPLAKSVEVGALVWLVAGGLSYTIGAVIYGLKRPNFYRLKLGFHEIFHLLTVLGTICHYVVMYRYI